MGQAEFDARKIVFAEVRAVAGIVERAKILLVIVTMHTVEINCTRFLCDNKRYVLCKISTIKLRLELFIDDLPLDSSYMIVI